MTTETAEHVIRRLYERTGIRFIVNLDAEWQYAEHGRMPLVPAA